MSEARRLYESLSEEFIRKGIASNRFSELEKLYHLASDEEEKKKKKSKLLKTFREWQKADYEELDLLRTFIITKDLEEEFDKWVSERLENEK